MKGITLVSALTRFVSTVWQYTCFITAYVDTILRQGMDCCPSGNSHRAVGQDIIHADLRILHLRKRPHQRCPMSETSPNLALPFIQPAQAQKHVTHNEAVELLDLIVQLSVQDFDATTPPASPIEGQVWAVGAGATGAWADATGKLAAFAGGGWFFITPVPGWRAWGVAGDELRVFTGGIWADLEPDFDNLEGLGVNAVYDGTNRVSVAADATLLNHDGAGHQLKLNKSGASDTASLLFQTGFSGRAEMGLAGTDDFAVKVSADGATWFAPLSVSGADGKVTLSEALNVAPGTAPSGPVAGDLYFDSGSAKLRCFDGTVWQDLF